MDCSWLSALSEHVNSEPDKGNEKAAYTNYVAHQLGPDVPSRMPTQMHLRCANGYNAHVSQTEAGTIPMQKRARM